MAKRIITALVAIPIAILMLVLYKTVFFNIAAGVIGGMIAFELLRATGCLEHKAFAYPTIAFAASFPIMMYRHLYHTLPFLVAIYLLLMFSLMLKNYEKVKYEKLFFMIAVSILICGSMYCFVDMTTLHKRYGIIYLTLALCLSWIADSGAYFAGTFLGKHKLCPNISPKKTVEGFIGGLLTNGIFVVIFNLVYVKICASNGIDLEVNYIVSFLLGAVCAAVGLLGDLTASIIKRQCGIKDYGKLFPGHGGMVDRFDSVMFVVPFTYFALHLFSIYK
ncbi:MAG: phosphatidate cytidylyltransferase [Oscillospiraceae bacterium]|nr:phosphatidate cytidylyltransferase [Oscillospiraceae bacterium]